MNEEVIEYQRHIIDTLILAKYARTEEERALHFRTAEKWSAQARAAENRAKDATQIN